MASPVTGYSDDELNDLSDYFYGAPIGLKATGPDGMITRANLAELTLLGYDGHAEEYVGHHLAEFFADPDSVQSWLDRLVAGERVLEHEATARRRQGGSQKVLLYANARTAGGEFRGARCFTFPHPDDLRPDIAEATALTDQSVDGRGLQLSEAERVELHRELRDFFDNAPISLHMVGGDGLIKHASKSELATMGYPAEAYLGQHIAGFHADQGVIDGMLEDLVGGTPLVNFSATLVRHDGSQLPVMIYSNSRMRDGSFVNTRCFTVGVPRAHKPPPRALEFGWPRNEDLGFQIPGRTAAGKPNPMTVALKYIASRKHPEESLGFLAHVSRCLAAPRRLRELLGEVTAATVPFLADLASVVTGEARLATSAIAALGRRADEVLARIAAMPAPEGVDSCLEIATASDPRVAQLRELGAGSMLRIPISIRGQRAGTLVLLREPPPGRRAFGPADRALGEELARRIAVAVEIDRLTTDA